MSNHINTSQSEKSAKPWIGSLFWKLVKNQCEAAESLNKEAVYTEGRMVKVL